MDVIAVLGAISGIIFLGFLAEQIFRKTNIPDVLLLIGVGIGMGTILEWTNAESFGSGASLFTTFALIFILFQGALSIDFHTLIKSLSSSMKITILNFFLTVIVITIISYMLGYNPLVAMLIGVILGGTSSAVVIPLVNSIEIKDKYGLILTLESAVSDVLSIIGTITILEIMNTGEVIASNIFNSILTSFSLALVVGLIVGLIWVIIMAKNELITKSYLLTVAVVVGLYAFVESPFVEGSGAIAALMFGLVLGNSRTLLGMTHNHKTPKDIEEHENKVIRNVLSPTAKNFYGEISFFVKTFFFVYLGILIDFSNPNIFIYGTFLTVGIYLIRPLAIKLVFGKENLEQQDRTFLEILIPKGLAAAVLAGLAVQSGVLGDEAGSFINMILSVVLLSILFTSILLFLTQKGWFKGFLPFLVKKPSEEK
jgi:NhaP-type Na+/H+ or K+/H+ antiporter